MANSHFQQAFDTQRWARPVKGETGQNIDRGRGVRMTGLPTVAGGLHEVTVCAAGERPHGVSAMSNTVNITPANIGTKVVTCDGPQFEICVDAAYAAGTKVKVTTADGKFGAAGMGIAEFELMEASGADGDICWAYRCAVL